MATRRGRSRCRSQADRASCGTPEQPSGAGSTSLLASATTWPLKRYGRFLSPTDSEDGERSGHSWKVFESNEESGHLILTIVVSGHFFISQGRTVLEESEYVCSSAVACSIKASMNLFSCQQVLGYASEMLISYCHLSLLAPDAAPPCSTLNAKQEGFSLIDAQKWLRIARRADCLLLHAQTKQNECRMFRVQFGGDSEEQMLEHCCSCVQKLAEYVPVHEADELSQNLCYSRSQVEDAEQNTSVLRVPDEPLPDSCTNSGERRSTMQLAQSVLNQKFELPQVYRHSAWSAQELGPFIRLCLMDQHFPAFVEEVEKELKKLTEG